MAIGSPKGADTQRVLDRIAAPLQLTSTEQKTRLDWELESEADEIWVADRSIMDGKSSPNRAFKRSASMSELLTALFRGHLSLCQPGWRGHLYDSP